MAVPLATGGASMCAWKASSQLVVSPWLHSPASNLRNHFYYRISHPVRSKLNVSRFRGRKSCCHTHIIARCPSPAQSGFLCTRVLIIRRTSLTRCPQGQRCAGGWWGRGAGRRGPLSLPSGTDWGGREDRRPGSSAWRLAGCVPGRGWRRGLEEPLRSVI